MRLISLREQQTHLKDCVEMYCGFLQEQELKVGAMKKYSQEKAGCEKLIQERLYDSDRYIFLFEKGRQIVGFAEVMLEELCFPDEDLPETCVKVVAFYIVPQARKQKLGSQFFKLVRDWGREQKAALIEAEVSSYPVSINQFLEHQGLELVGAGARNCYRAFI